MPPPPPQALLKRHPTLSRHEFSEAWKRHGRLVAPWLITYGVAYYAQIHNIQLAASNEENSGEANSEEPINIEEWDGAAEMVFTASDAQKEEWSKTDPAYKGYFQNVILADERRFLVSEALMHVKRVKPGTVEGHRVVIIEDGRIQVDIPEDIQQEWDRWNRR